MSHSLTLCHISYVVSNRHEVRVADFFRFLFLSLRLTGLLFEDLGLKIRKNNSFIHRKLKMIISPAWKKWMSLCKFIKKVLNKLTRDHGMWNSEKTVFAERNRQIGIYVNWY